MIEYSINAKGIEFIKATLNARHAAFCDEPATTEEALTYVNQIEKDCNFTANGNSPEFCKDKPSFILFSGWTISEEFESHEMSFDMFDQREYEPGDRG